MLMKLLNKLETFYDYDADIIMFDFIVIIFGS